MKVLIVDDEVIIREAISKVVPWEEHGYQVLDPVSSAEEAFSVIQEQLPEIILTDIKMGGKTGLELASEIHHLGLPMEVIVLTGFSEFTYVQQAIREGVSDYLLKTSSTEEILEAVDHAKNRVWHKRKQASLEKTEDRRELSFYVSKMIKKNCSMQERKKLEVMLSLEKGSYYQIMVIDTSLDNKRLMEFEQDWNAYVKSWWFSINDQTIILAQRPQTLQDDYLLHLAIQKVYQQIREPFLLGSPVTEIRDLSVSYEQAKALIVYKWMLKEKDMIRREEIIHRQGISNVEVIRKHENQFLKTISTGNKEELQDWLERTLEQMMANQQATPDSIHLNMQSLYITLVRLIHRVAYSNGTDIEEIPVLLSVHQWLPSPQTLLVPTFMQLLDIYHQLASDDVGFVEIAIEYMEKNLENFISLTEVADFVHVHPNYLSDLLRKRTGKTYVELITELRIQKAKELLLNSATKIKNISQQIGYSDWKYFTTQFKKITGQTPSQYREQNKRAI